jgi:hypothetical protein
VDTPLPLSFEGEISLEACTSSLPYPATFLRRLEVVWLLYSTPQTYLLLTFNAVKAVGHSSSCSTYEHLQVVQAEFDLMEQCC